MKHILLFWLIISASSLFAFKVKAQEENNSANEKPSLRMEERQVEAESLRLGIEFGVEKNYKSFIQMGMWLQTQRDFYRLRIAGAVDAPLLIQNTDDINKDANKSSTKAIYDYGFIYGRIIPIAKNHALKIGSGISFIQKIDPLEANQTPHDSDTKKYVSRWAVGLPIELSYGYAFYRRIEVTGSFNNNINRLKGYSAISFGIAAPF